MVVGVDPLFRAGASAVPCWRPSCRAPTPRRCLAISKPRSPGTLRSISTSAFAWSSTPSNPRAACLCGPFAEIRTSTRSAAPPSDRPGSRAAPAARPRGSATTVSSSGTPANTSGSRVVTPKSSVCISRARPKAAARPIDDADDRQAHALAARPCSSPATRSRRARGGCRSPACAAPPSTPSGRRCRSPPAAARTTPNTVISHMLKRCRDVERETTSSIDRTSVTGRPVACRSCSWTWRAEQIADRPACARPRPSA